MNRPESAAAATSSAAADQQPKLHEQSAELREGFVLVPLPLLYWPHLSHAALRLYMVLRAHAWYGKDRVWPGQALLARRLGCTERQTRRLLDDLARLGLVRIERTGKRRTNCYLLVALDLVVAHDQQGRPLAPPLECWPAAKENTESAPVHGRTASATHHDQTAVSGGDRTPPAAPDRTPMSAENRGTEPQLQEATARRDRAGVTPASTSLPKDRHPVVARLTSFGVTRRAAGQLVEQYGAEACLRQCEWLPHRQARDPAAVLVRAIQEQWAAPAALEQGRAMPARGDRAHSPSSLADIFAAVADETGSTALAGMAARKEGPAQ